VENKDAGEVFVPPVAIQSLLENAINHNKFSADQPLHITISAVNNFIEVRNSLNKRSMMNESTGVGLNNIRQRYELIAGKKIVVEETGLEFIVRLPFLRKDDYESFNH
jgi:LytS/YehU family sensor histidine kinase